MEDNAPDQTQNQPDQSVSPEEALEQTIQAQRDGPHPDEPSGTQVEGVPKPSNRFVPIRALEGEQRVREEAEVQRNALIERARAVGFEVTDEGEILSEPVQPQLRGEISATQPQPQQDPFAGLRAFAEENGWDMQQVMNAFGPALEAAVSPLYESTAATRLDARLGTLAIMDDPENASVYMGTLKEIIQQAPPAMRLMIVNDDGAFQKAVDMAKARHVKGIAQKMAERIVMGRGRIVGQFTERAAPGASEGQTAFLTPEADAFANKVGLNAEQKARAAARIARRNNQGQG